MNKGPESYKNKYEALRLEYRETLPQKKQAIDHASRAARNGRSPAEQYEGIELLRVIAHKLAGSGAVFGYAEISGAAQRLEATCISLPRPTETNVDGLWRRIEKAVSGLKSAIEETCHGGQVRSEECPVLSLRDEITNTPEKTAIRPRLRI